MNDVAPAQVFHPSQFIAEEMEARGWGIHEMAMAMGGDYGVSALSLELYLTLGPTNPDIRLGDATDIARAFGTSAELWQNLEAMWLRWPDRRDAALQEPDR